MTTVAIVLRKDKLNKDNKAPIHFRIITNRKIRYIASGILIQPHFWDKANKQVKKGVTNAARINAMLAQRFADIQALALDAETAKPKTISAKKIKQMICGSANIDFITFSNDFIEGYKLAGKVGTYDRYKSVLQKLKDYIADKPLYFSDIDVEFLIRYERHLIQKHNNRVNTIHANMKVLRRIFNAAFERNLIEISDNPFLKYKLKTEKTIKPFLTEDELKTFDEVDLTNKPLLQDTRDMFVWSCYAGGLRISDLLLLKWANFDGSHIHFTIRKTGHQHSIKLPLKALAILEKIKAKHGQTRYIFNLLSKDLDETNPFAIDYEISVATALYNKRLKEISKECKFTKHLSSHISRHTFATRALKKGISLDKVQHILQHHNPSITQIYAKLISEDVDKAMELLN